MLKNNAKKIPIVRKLHWKFEKKASRGGGGGGGGEEGGN